jgi:hypothetical protein
MTAAAAAAAALHRIAGISFLFFSFFFHAALLRRGLALYHHITHPANCQRWLQSGKDGCCAQRKLRKLPHRQRPIPAGALGCIGRQSQWWW